MALITNYLFFFRYNFDHKFDWKHQTFWDLSPFPRGSQLFEAFSFNKISFVIHTRWFFQLALPCLVPKWKKVNEATRGSLRWRISWNNSFGWLFGILSFWFLMEGRWSWKNLFMIFFSKISMDETWNIWRANFPWRRCERGLSVFTHYKIPNLKSYWNFRRLRSRLQKNQSFKRWQHWRFDDKMMKQLQLHNFFYSLQSSRQI